ncbi:MAG: protein of unknown function endonuclease [Frankiales bacterium]|nr:protein of unknown function endonuclease [Frankiales bacterium]
MFPGCRLLAQICQNDHVDPWPLGKTEEANIDSKCVHHHQSKTEKYFTVHKDECGVHWTTPAGRTYTRPPRPLLRGW